MRKFRNVGLLTPVIAALTALPVYATACLSDAELVNKSIDDFGSLGAAPCSTEGDIYMKSFAANTFGTEEMDAAGWSGFALVRSALGITTISEVPYRVKFSDASLRMLQLGLIEQIATETSERKRALFAIILTDATELYESGQRPDIEPAFIDILDTFPGYAFYRKYYKGDHFAAAYLYCFLHHDFGENDMTTTLRSLSFRECMPKWRRANETTFP